MKLRFVAHELFTTTLRKLSIPNAMRRCVSRQDDVIFAGEQAYALQDFRRLVVISIGKAAVPMCDALLLHIQPVREEGRRLDSIVVGPSEPVVLEDGLRYFPGDHPVPGRNAQAAANTILSLLSTCGAECLVFFLLSGGASAMVELALNDRFSLDEVAGFHQALVYSGLPVAKMNVLRKHFSRVKGGRLAVAARGAAQCTLLISDVPGEVLHVVGSGPSLPDPSTVEECRAIIDASGASLAFSRPVREYFMNPGLEETPKAHHDAFRKSSYFSLLSSDDLCTIAAQAARAQGFHVEIDNRCDDWDYRDAARHLLHRLEELRRRHSRVCLVSAGEVSVQLPAKHGTGGRNQQFVLECARRLSDYRMRAAVLSGGSDGVDGNSTAAGAVCDETTFARAAERGLDAMVAFDQFDSAPLFASLGDAILTGPTGNNVRDLRILLSEG